MKVYSAHIDFLSKGLPEEGESFEFEAENMKEALMKLGKDRLITEKAYLVTIEEVEGEA